MRVNETIITDIKLFFFPNLNIFRAHSPFLALLAELLEAASLKIWSLAFLRFHFDDSFRQAMCQVIIRIEPATA